MDHISLAVLLKWIHLMATVAWIGGMFTNFFIYIPAIGKTLDAPLAGKLMGAAMKRFRVMVYIAMLTFIITGIMMGSLHLNYEGAFHSGNLMIAILIFKVPLYVIMVILAIVAFEVHAPRVARLAAEGPSPKLLRAQRSQKVLAMAGFVVGVLILALSAAL
jgi:uncharacterized membrane protein